MLRFLGLCALMFCVSSGIYSQKNNEYVPKDYVWTSQSENSSGSMPCGGHDVGLNVWVEKGEVLLYMSQSGWFDENNTLLKAGRLRLHLDGNPLDGADFRQALSLDDGSVLVSGGGVEVRIWADVFEPCVYVCVNGDKKRRVRLSYESWRHRDRQVTKAEAQQCSYKWIISPSCTTKADVIETQENGLTFRHLNGASTVMDETVEREGLTKVRRELYDPLSNRRMEGKLTCDKLRFSGTSEGEYASTDFKAWNFEGDVKSACATIVLKNYVPQPSVSEKESAAPSAKVSRKRSSEWWHRFWQRSYIVSSNDTVAHIARNYELFRYMLGCNAYGEWPSKFNGGLFTFDPVYVRKDNPFTPDYRCWGGGTMTAQNQRLVYWPMLKSGDVDMMRSQLDTYRRMLPSAVARTKFYWGHEGASYTEQIENFGLPNPAEYGKHKEGDDMGVERNAWLEYEWDTSLEFCLMALEAHRYYGTPIKDYEDMIRQCLVFFDAHYQMLAKRMGVKSLDSDGHLVIYPGSGGETFKMAYNPSSTIAALRTVGSSWLGYLRETKADSVLLSEAETLLEHVPAIPLRTIGADTCIAPAVAWARVQNVETMQMYPVFPWRTYGVGRPGLSIARNTWTRDPHALQMRSAKGWKQDNVWAACLGLVEEAAQLCQQKFADGPFRFPAFWEPGFDWSPDLNRGGSAMIGLQEMLLQEKTDGTVLAFPAWPANWNVKFRLNASGGRLVEGEISGGVKKISEKSSSAIAR